MVRFLIVLLFPTSLFGQFQVTPSTTIPVNHGNGQEMLRAWTGGINAAQISTFDADNDGINDDVFVFDKAGNRSLVFIGNQEGGEMVHLYDPHSTVNFPVLTDWALLRDYNCDGKKDIFTYSSAGGSFAIYQNMTANTGPPQFELANNSLQTLYPFTSNPVVTNIYISSQDIPAIFDFDEDGDMDILVFTLGGTTLEYHENQSVENTGECGLDNFVLRNRCYGQFEEGLESNNVTLGTICSFNVPNPKTGDGNRHIGSTLLAFDATADGLPDIILGDVTYSNLTFLENGVGTNGRDSIVSSSVVFPAGFGGPALSLDNFPAAYYEDVSGDGVRDLLVGVNNPFLSANERSVWFYENTGLDNAPVFAFRQTDFLQDEMIDLGEVSAPALFDYNGDGLMDLVIGSRGEFLGGSEFLPRLDLYLNTGSITEPAFQSEATDWLNLSALGIGQYMHPTFGDIDNDGDTDMMVGDASGQVHFLENTAGPGNMANFQYSGLAVANGNPISVGQNSTPQLYDLDGDGKFDLIIGERNGNLNYYRNTGSITSPSFTLFSDTLGGVSTVEPFLFIGSSAPHFFRYEETTYLLLGAESGSLHLYSNIDGNVEGDYTLETLTAFNVNMGSKSRAVIYNLNGDGYPDVIAGGIGGGLQLFMGSGPVNTDPLPVKKSAFKLYPNPADEILNVDGLSADSWHFRIYSISGQLVKVGSLNGNQMNVSDLSSGASILEISNGEIPERMLWMKR